MENNIVHSIKEFPLVYFLAKNICDDMGVPLNDVKISKDGRDGSLAGHVPGVLCQAWTAFRDGSGWGH